MIFQVNKATEQLITDMIRINSDRIAYYQSALNKSESIDTDVWNTLFAIIAEAKQYRLQLSHKLNLPEENISNHMSTSGKIYKAWADLKVVLVNNTQRAIISSCLYYEEIALQTYQVALSSKIKLTDDTHALLTQQENGIRLNYDILKRFRSMRQAAPASLMYFG